MASLGQDSLSLWFMTRALALMMQLTLASDDEFHHNKIFDTHRRTSRLDLVDWKYTGGMHLFVTVVNRINWSSPPGLLSRGRHHLCSLLLFGGRVQFSIIIAIHNFVFNIFKCFDAVRGFNKSAITFAITMHFISLINVSLLKRNENQDRKRL